MVGWIDLIGSWEYEPRERDARRFGWEALKEKRAKGGTQNYYDRPPRAMLMPGLRDGRGLGLRTLG